MRTLLFAIAAVFAAAGAVQADPAPPASGPPGVVSFMGARLGMGLTEWKAMAYPGANPAQVRAQCADQAPAAAPAKRGRTAASAPPPATPTLVCTYVNRMGGVALPLSMPLADHFLVRRPQYDFVDGRLASIEFHTSIDAFNALSARFEARYGPAQIQRDDVTLSDGLDLPRVRKTWRLPGGSVEIVDPTSPPSQLAVQFTGS